MSLIDWSDPEEMLGLLVEYVADESNASRLDRERRRFLHGLAAQLRDVAETPAVDVHRLAGVLSNIRSSQPAEFESDAVIAHLDDCIGELDRIASERASRSTV